MSWLFALCACMSIVAVVLICVFLFANGVPAMKEIGFIKFLLGTDWDLPVLPEKAAQRIGTAGSADGRYSVDYLWLFRTGSDGTAGTDDSGLHGCQHADCFGIAGHYDSAYHHQSE